MKLIVAGSTGFVATELIKQALSNSAITSLVALSRRATILPQNDGVDTTKFKSVVCEDFENYPESLKQDLAGANACIWLIGITPGQMKKMSSEESRKICHDYAMVGLKTISTLANQSMGKPFRFIYISGAKAERDQSKKPWPIGGYLLMRGEVESHVLEYAKESNGIIEGCVAKPGLIDAPGRQGLLLKIASTVGRNIIGLPKVDVSEIAATLLDQAVNGIEKETLLNEDLIRIGQKVLNN